MSSRKFNQMHYETKGFTKSHLYHKLEVSPQLAADLLTLNTDNRPIKQAVLKAYTNDMSSSKWYYTGDTVGISKTGKLLNGQHRLMAVVASGITQVTQLE